MSRALADSPLIPQETKQKIAALVKEHNYRRNMHVRNFRTKETLTIAVLILDASEKDWRLSYPFFLELLSSMADIVTRNISFCWRNRLLAVTGNETGRYPRMLLTAKKSVD